MKKMHFAGLLFLLAPIHSYSAAVNVEICGSSFKIKNAAKALLIINGSLIDPQSKLVSSGHILVEEDKIKAIRSCNAAPLVRGESLEIIDAKQKWVLPGLFDMHAHLFGGNVSPVEPYSGKFDDFADRYQLGLRYLYSGITSYADLFSPNDGGDDTSKPFGADKNIFEFKREVESAAIDLHPNMFVAGPIVGVPNSHGVFGTGKSDGFGKGDVIVFHWKEESGEPYSASKMAKLVKDVKKRINLLISKKKPDFIKFVYDNDPDVSLKVNRPDKMPLEIAKAIINAANAKKVLSIAHVGSWEAVEELSKAGVSAITHLPGGPAPQSAIAAMKRNPRGVPTYAISTIAIFMDYGDMHKASFRRSFLSSSLLKKVSTQKLLAAYADYANYSDEDKIWSQWGRDQNEKKAQKKSLASLIKAEIPVMAGTDTTNTGSIAGYSLHRELLRWELIGVDNWKILQGATSIPAAFLGVSRGVLQERAFADLLILDENPMEKIENLQKIHAVILNGKKVDRDRLNLLNARSPASKKNFQWH